MNIENNVLICIDDANEYGLYDIEFEPEGSSSDDEQYESDDKRSRKFKSKKVCDSSGESDIEDIVIADAVKRLNLVEEYSEEISDEGDEEAESSDEANDFTKVDPENQDYWKCLNCKQPNKPCIRYCSACYRVIFKYLNRIQSGPSELLLVIHFVN